MPTWFRALHIRMRDNARLRREVEAATLKADRLEIVVRRQQLRLDELATDLERLSDRITATQGRLLGGRPKKAATAPENDQLTLDAIPPGDKDALRRYYRLNPPKKPTNDTEH
jgi:hypothetical protein